MHRYDAFISYNQKSDTLVAARLQFALHRLAKPWYTRRATRICRDETDLTVSPSGWSQIEAALAESRFLVLLASPESAASKWVNREVRYWLENRDRKNLIIVCTGGDIVWNERANDFDWSRTTALSQETFAGTLVEEPLWQDLSWARREHELGLRNPEFLRAVAKICAPIRGMDVDSLLSTDHREHRRTMRLAYAALATLTVLTLVSVVATVVARQQQQLAVEQRNSVLVRQLGATAELQRQEPYEGVIVATLLAAESMRRGQTLEGYLALAKSLALSPRGKRLRLEHGSRVHSVRFSRHGRWLATASEDRNVSLWDVSTGRRVWNKLHSRWRAATRVDFDSQDTTLVSSASDSQTVSVYSTANGEPLAIAQNPPNASVVAVYSSKPQVLSRDSHGVLWMWTASTGEPFRRLNVPVPNEGLSVDPRGRHFATFAEGASEVVVHAGISGEELSRFANGAVLTAITYDRQGEALITCGADGQIRFWALQSRSLTKTLDVDVVCRQVLTGPDGRGLVVKDAQGRLWGSSASSDRLEPIVADLQFSTDDVFLDVFGRIVAAWPSEGVAKIFDRSGTEVLRIAHTHGVSAVDLDGTGRLIATGSADGSATIADVEGGLETASIDASKVGDAAPDAGAARISDVSFSEDNGRVALLVGERAVVISLPELITVGSVDATSASKVVLSRSGATLVVVGPNSSNVHDVGTGNALGMLPRSDENLGTIHRGSPDGFGVVSADGHIAVFDRMRGVRRVESSSTTMALSPDGRYLFAAGSEPHIQRWSLEDLQGDAAIGATSPVRLLVFDRMGTRIAGAGSYGGIQVWDAQDLRELARFKHEIAVVDVEFLADNRLLAYSDNRILRSWSISSGVEIARFELDNSMDGIFASPTGEPLAVVTWQSPELLILGATNLEFRQRLVHRDEIAWGAFHRDGRYLATLANDDIVRIWDTKTGTELVRLPPLENIKSARFAGPDERYLVTVQADGMIRTWRWRSSDLVAQACGRLPRSLTDKEWERFLPEVPYRNTCDAVP